MMKKKAQYISNKDFTLEVSRWKAEWDAHMKETGKRLRVSDLMAVAFMKLTTRYSAKSNFAGYTYIDDMRGEAVLSCVKYAHNFDPTKSNNAFAYFTQIIHNAFLQFLGKEKNLSNFKFNMVKIANPSLAKHDYNDIRIGEGSLADF